MNASLSAGGQSLNIYKRLRRCCKACADDPVDSPAISDESGAARRACCSGAVLQCKRGEIRADAQPEVVVPEGDTFTIAGLPSCRRPPVQRSSMRTMPAAPLIMTCAQGVATEHFVFWRFRCRSLTIRHLQAGRIYVALWNALGRCDKSRILRPDPAWPSADKNHSPAANFMGRLA
jgi:hypothetical protein